MASIVAAWPTVALGEVVTQISRSESVQTDKEYRLLGIRLDGNGPFLREVKLGGQISATSLSRVEAGDFIYSRLFAWRGAFGVIDPLLGGCYVSGEFPTFQPCPDRLDTEFLRLWFRLPSTLAAVEADCTGSTPLTRNRFKEHFFLAMQIPLPPLDEQRRIVAHIEALAARIEQARALRREALAEAEALFKAALDAEFDRIYALDGQTATVGEVEELVTSGPRNFGSRYTNQGYRFYRAQDITSDGQIATYGAVHVDIPQTMSTRALVRAGDILIVITGATIGRSAVVLPHHPHGLVSQHVGLVRVNEAQVNPRYLHYCILAPKWAGGQINGARYGQGKPGLNLANLRSLRFPTPSMSIQQCTVEHLDEAKAHMERLKKLQTDTQTELDALLPSILDKAFRGEL